MDVLGEALAPNLNLFDYHIGFDPADKEGCVLEAPCLFAYCSKLEEIHFNDPTELLNEKAVFAVMFIRMGKVTRTAFNCSSGFPSTKK